MAWCDKLEKLIKRKPKKNCRLGSVLLRLCYDMDRRIGIHYPLMILSGNEGKNVLLFTLQSRDVFDISLYEFIILHAELWTNL